MRTIRFNLVLWYASCVACAGCTLPARWSNTDDSSSVSSTSAVGDRQVANVQMVLAQTLERQGQLEQAQLAYTRLASRENAPVEAFHRLARIHDKMGRGAEASPLYERYLAERPEDSHAHGDYGYSLYLRREWKASEHHLRQALTLQPNNTRARNNLGLLLARTGRADEALHQFKLAGNTPAQGRANLGFCLAGEGQWDAAEQQFDLALLADPQCDVAHNGRSQLIAARSRAGGQVAAGARQQPITPKAANLH